MPDSNYSALAEGVKLYTDGMRRFVKERLIVAYPESWWETGVLAHLTDAQKTNVKRDTEKDPKKDRLDHLDAQHIARVLNRNFDKAFKAAFGDFNKTRSLLEQVAASRNELVAHSRSGDLLADDAGHALYAMKELLGAAGLPEAGPVEELRRDVLKIEQAPEKAEVKKIQPAKAGELPYWWQVCEPVEGFKDPFALDESLFAATLGLVYAGAAREQYQDPKQFFAHTYFTEGLKFTIRDVASRLSGGAGPAVTEMQTPFGGGKTHALLTLYHLIKHPKESLSVPGVKEAISEVSIPPKARVLVFDGQMYGTEPVSKEDGTSVSTLWGELAYQSDPGLFHRLLMDSDSRGEAPGNTIYMQLLEAAAPCLIIIDELVSYLVKLKFSNIRKTEKLYHQTVQFLHDTLRLVGNVPGVAVLISLPVSKKEFGGINPEQLQQELAISEDMRVRTDPVATKRTPVNDEEIYTLASKRLFKKADRDVAQRVAKTYREAYERTRGLYEPTIFSADYLQQQVAAYPLHPELVDVLYKKWSTASDFPRTRSVLQLLASIVADQWVNRREAYAIHSAHVNLERERIRTKIISAAGGGGWDGIVAADIVGGDAHADELDDRRGGDYARLRIARGVATTLLMHSFGGLTRSGALPTELRLGTVAPNVGPEYVGEVMESLEQSLWYVHREGELLRFQNKANLYRMISQRAETLSAAAVGERLRSAIDEATGVVPGFKLLEWAGIEGVIPDRPDATIAVLASRYLVSGDDSDDKGRKPVEQLWEKAGGGLRQWRNALILVAPDGELWAKAEEAMREAMAYEAVLDSIGKKPADVSATEKRDLEARAREKKESLRTSVVTAYRWVFYPDDKDLATVGLPVPATKDERIAKRVFDRLSDQNYGHPKILENMGAAYFDSKLAPRLWRTKAVRWIWKISAGASKNGRTCPSSHNARRHYEPASVKVSRSVSGPWRWETTRR